MWKVSRPVGEWMVAALEPERGQTILELAAGPGETGFVAAPQLGDGGKLISTDISPAMVEAAKRRSAELGLTNVECRVIDAENMDLPDDSVDGVLSRWGYMLLAEPAKAMVETRRVLRDGGRLVFSVWGPAERNPWAAISGAALVGHGHMPAPEPGAPGMFAMASDDRIRELVTGAGFAEPRIEHTEVEWRFDDFDDYWRFINELAGGLAVVIAQLSDAERETVRATIRDSLEGFRAKDGYTISGVTNNVVTT